MPAEPGAFTVLAEGARGPVNVVRPLRRAVHPPHPPHPPPAMTLLDPKFSRALDVKLRRLQETRALRGPPCPPRPPRRPPRASASEPDVSAREPPGAGARVSRSQPRLDALAEGERPRFVTTVRAGRFLPPPPGVARLLGLEALYPAAEGAVYSYASRPRPLGGRRRDPGPERAPPPPPPPCARAGEAFRGVRALVAGVAGLSGLLPVNRHDGSVAGYSNLMHDKRVVRGSTFAAHPHAAGDGAESAAARAARTRRRAMARRAALARLRPASPPPAPGRRHLPVQTEYYLEELFEKGVEMEVGVQTDLFADRPATPRYVPAKTGADAATQIYPGDLFDFELEVQPILEVLVGKTAQQALAEVAQEEELAALREQRRRHAELRAAELAERQRLAAQDARLHLEKERRVAEGRAACAAATEARGRVACAALVAGYVAELLPAALAGLRDARYLQRRLLAGVEEEAMPWLVAEVARELEALLTSRDVIAEIAHDVVQARAELYQQGARSPPPSPPESDTSSDQEEEEEHEGSEP